LNRAAGTMAQVFGDHSHNSPVFLCALCRYRLFRE
jgi:hypothetical protein